MYDEMIEVDPYCIRQYNSKSWLFGFFYAPKDLKLFGFPIFWLWAYLMKVIPETIWYLRFNYIDLCDISQPRRPQY